MSSFSILLLIAGIISLTLGAEGLVRGASRLAALFGIPPLIIGLTIVSIGTSAPETAVSIQAAISGQPDVAIGNVIGSNIFNILFVLGLSASLFPLIVSQQLVRLDVPVMIGVSLVFYLMGMDGRISRIEGILLITGIIIYTLFLIRLSRHENPDVQQEYSRQYAKPGTSSLKTCLVHTGLILVGLFLLVTGSRWMVRGAVEIAQALGISELIISLTIVAIGTSLPEVATSVIATIRGERDIAVGNVVGSNIYNILLILGLAGLFTPSGLGVPSAVMRFDMLVMIGAAVACLPVFFTGNRISRWEGLLFLGYYVVYTTHLILFSSHHHALPMFKRAITQYVLPLTVITLLVVTIRALRQEEKKGKQAQS